jgi:hypothetical protein
MQEECHENRREPTKRAINFPFNIGRKGLVQIQLGCSFLGPLDIIKLPSDWSKVKIMEDTDPRPTPTPPPLPRQLVEGPLERKPGAQTPCFYDAP